MPRSVTDEELYAVMDEALKAGAIKGWSVERVRSGSNRWGPNTRRIVTIQLADGSVYEANPTEAISMAQAALAAKEA